LHWLAEMNRELAEKFLKWKAEHQDFALVKTEAITLVEYLAAHVFVDYEPAEFSTFNARLEKWLLNLETEEKQKLLFSMIPHILYVGKREFNSLYRSAYRGQIARWIIDKGGLDILNSNFDTNLKNAFKNTWICPLTDSLRINSFLKINSCSGHDLRPDWRSLFNLGSDVKIKDYVQRMGIQRIVLLEDFIGSSNQSKLAVKYACETLSNCEVMLCPLIICAEGHAIFSDLASTIDNLAYDPVLVINENVKFSSTAAIGEPSLFSEVRKLNTEMATKIEVSVNGPNGLDGYGDCGALVVMQTNCPDNSHRMIWAKTQAWQPLFPRVDRQY
jgi:hypothetical protein